MKKLLNIFLILILFGISSCNEILNSGKEYNLPEKYLILYQIKDTLTYESDLSNKEIFVVDSIINGSFLLSTTGTCGKSPFDTYYFQSVYVRSLTDTLNNYLPESFDDCWGIPTPETECINYIKGLVDIYLSRSLTDVPDGGSEISWYNQLITNVRDYDSFYEIKKLNQKEFQDVFVYETDNVVQNMQNDEIVKWYYTHKLGFVGYVKKSGEIFELIE